MYLTTTRSLGNGAAQFACRVGAASAPWIAKGLKVVGPSAPFVVMGVIVVIAAVLCVVLPETKNSTTSQGSTTSQDVKDRGGNNRVGLA